MIRENWIKVELGEVIKLKNGYAFKSSKYKDIGIPIIRISDINQGIVKADSAKMIDESEEYDDYQVEFKDILIAMSGATTGKFGIYKDSKKTYQNQRVGNLKPHSEQHIDKLYIYYLLYSLRQRIEKDAYGGAQPNISGKKIESLEFNLAPLPEQRAIVAKIEQLLSDLDNGIANLKIAKGKLEIYRQAVLKKAFEGGFTNRDYKPGELPEGWERISLEDYGEWRGGGTPSKRNNEYWENGNVLWVSPKDMKTKIIVQTQDKITEVSIDQSSAKWIEKGAILFVVRSGIIRRILPIALAGKRLTINQDLQSFLPNNKLISEFVYWYCVSEERTIRDICAKDGTTVDNINVPMLKRYSIPLTTLPEQSQIVQEIETRLSVCDKLTESIDQSLDKSEALRQSILKKAFEGRLLSEEELEACRQEHDWEPAKKLFARIKAEKVKTSKI